ncbi:Lysophospholipase L1 [Lachnospiraceae bacterium]|nr:Lysophospholipase L1 [Lachnospiraceae bacterium]
MASKRKRKSNKKKQSIIMTMPLTLCLIASVIGFTVFGFVRFINAKGAYKYNWKTPFVVAAFTEGSVAKEVTTEAAQAVETTTESDNKIDTATKSEADQDPNAEIIEKYEKIKERTLRPMIYEEVPFFTPKSAYYVYTGKKPLTTVYPYIEADDSYFTDTLFIGDSRIEGLADFGNIENAEFIYKEGISVYNILDEVLVYDGESAYFSDIIGRKKYKQVYIMLGVNELGKGYADEYAEKYNELIEYIHRIQKDAIVIVLGNMYVTKEYSESSEVFNNDNINARNSLVAGYIDGKDTMYLDINPAFVDKEGYLDQKYTNDGIHLSAEYYELWVDFLKKHALESEVFK